MMKETEKTIKIKKRENLTILFLKARMMKKLKKECLKNKKIKKKWKNKKNKKEMLFGNGSIKKKQKNMTKKMFSLIFPEMDGMLSNKKK